MIIALDLVAAIAKDDFSGNGHLAGNLRILNLAI
jgi:hypothetical protein